MSVRKVSFIGLGVMGYPMAGYLKKNNYEVTVFNRTSSKSEKWVDQFQGLSENTPGKACVNSEIVFIYSKSSPDTKTPKASDAVI